MKLGLITSILDGMTFEEVVDFCSRERTGVSGGSMLAEREGDQTLCRSKPH